MKKILAIGLLGVLLSVIFGVAWVPITTKTDISGLSSITDKPYLLVFFGFATCSDVCPRTLASLSMIEDETLHTELEVFFVEVIDLYMTQDQAKAYATAFHPNFKAIVPTQEQLQSWIKEFGLNLDRSPEAPSHMGRLYLLKKEASTMTLIKSYGADKFNISQILADANLEDRS